MVTELMLINYVSKTSKAVAVHKIPLQSKPLLARPGVVFIGYLLLCAGLRAAQRNHQKVLSVKNGL